MFDYIKYSFFYIVILLVTILNGCEKEQKMANSDKDIEFYLLKNYAVEQGTDMIINSTAEFEDSALISYSQILSYDSTAHQFELSESAMEHINQDGGLKCHFKAFAVTVDNKIVYTGYFWPAYASSIKMWFTINPVHYYSGNGLKVNMAYPTDEFAGDYKDLRNDSRLIEVFRKDGKLKY